MLATRQHDQPNMSGARTNGTVKPSDVVGLHAEEEIDSALTGRAGCTAEESAVSRVSYRPAPRAGVA
jgi:hypothetical protein